MIIQRLIYYLCLVKKSHGLYSSPTKLLKCWIGIIALVLSQLFIISISLGRYPTKLKLSESVPVFLITRRTQIIIELCLYCQTSTEYLRGLCILEWWITLKNTIQLSLPSVAFAKDILLNKLYNLFIYLFCIYLFATRLQ